MSQTLIDELCAEQEAGKLHADLTRFFHEDRATTWRLAWDDGDLLDGELEALRLLWVERDPIAARAAYDEAMSAHIESLVKSHIDNGTTPPNF